MRRYKKYVMVVTAATGVLSDNYFALDQADIDTLCTIGSLSDIGNKSASDTVWCTNT